MTSEARHSPCSDAVPAVVLCVRLAHNAQGHFLLTTCLLLVFYMYSTCHMSVCFAIFILLLCMLLCAAGLHLVVMYAAVCCRSSSCCYVCCCVLQVFILLLCMLLCAAGGSQSFHDAMSLQPSGHRCGPGGANAAFDQVNFWSLLVPYCDVTYSCTSCSLICFAFLFCCLHCSDYSYCL